MSQTSAAIFWFPPEPVWFSKIPILTSNTASRNACLIFPPKGLEGSSQYKGYLQPLQQQQQQKQNPVPRPPRSSPCLSGSLGPVLHVLRDKADSRRIHPSGPGSPTLRSRDLSPQSQLPRYFTSRQSAPPALIGSPRSGRPMRMTYSGARAEEGSSQEPSTPGARGWQRAVCKPGPRGLRPSSSSLPSACGCWRPAAAWGHREEATKPVWAKPAESVRASPDFRPPVAPCSIPRSPRAEEPSSKELGLEAPGVRGRPALQGLLCRSFLH